MDIPRYVRSLIQHRVDNGLPTHGAEVLCNHGAACPPGQDADGDGHCNNVDHCPSTWTTGNYDKDFDGLGDGPGPRAFTAQPGQCLDEQVWSPIISLIMRRRDEPELPFNISVGSTRIPACRRECDNCPQEPNSAQDDADEDGYGDRCDIDIDDDGIYNLYDCDRFNEVVDLDLDRDGACDDQPATWDPVEQDNEHNRCLDECTRLANDLTAYYDPDCRDKCRPDNCIYDDLATDTACAGILPHISVDCSTLMIGERWLGNLRFGFTGLYICERVNSTPPDFTLCRTVYGNPYRTDWYPAYQPDQDGDGIGDRCDLPVVTELQFYPTPGTYGTFNGNTYSVDFNAWGGTASMGSGGSVSYTPELRTDTRVGACPCPITVGAMPNEWDENGSCWTDYCSRSRERFTYGPHPNSLFWNPINSPEVNQGYDCSHQLCFIPYLIADQSNQHDQIRDHALFHHRQMYFSLNDQNDSRHFTWEWHDSVRLDTVQQLQPIGDTYEADGLSDPNTKIATRVRVVWNQFDQNEQVSLPQGSYDNPDRIITYSDYQLMKETPPSVYPGDIPEIAVPIPLRRIPQLDEVIWWSDPSGPAGFLLGRSEKNRTFHVYALSRTAMQVMETRRVKFTDTPEEDTVVTGVSGACAESTPGVSGAAVAASAGTVGSETEVPAVEMQAAVFLFQPGRYALSDRQTDAEALPSKLWLGVVSGGSPGDDLYLQTTEERFGTVAPIVFDVALIPFNGYQLFVLGSAVPDGPQNVLWSMDLQTGQWTGPTTLDLPACMRGLSAVTEPVSKQILLFGGDATECMASGAVCMLDPITLAVQSVAGSGTTPAGVPRSQAGIFLDSNGQKLYVYGGTQAGVALTDAWLYSLDSSTWELLGSGDTAVGGPGPALAPLVYHDPTRDALWVGDFNKVDTADGLPVYALDREGIWRMTSAIRLPSMLTWPVEDTYVYGQSRAYMWPTPEGMPLPGSLYLGQVSLDAEGLGLKVSATSGSPLGRSDPVASAVPDAAFRCLTGQSCVIEVKPMPGYGGAQDFTPFILDVRKAAPVLQTERQLPGQIKDLVLHGDQLVAAGPAGLWTLNSSNLDIQGDLSLHPVTGLSSCGEYVCASSNGLYGLTVVGLSDPVAPQVWGSTSTVGPSWDLAAKGQRAYLAHGVAGVGIYHVSSEGQPSYQQTVSMSGMVRTVALQKKMLVAGRLHGEITLYDISAAPVQVGSLQAQGQISRVRFVAGQLWVLGKQEAWVEVWDVSEPSTPVRLGSFSTDAAWHFRAIFLGASALASDGKRVQRYNLLPVTQ